MSEAASHVAARLRSPARRGRSRCRGAGLIEVVVATLILGLFSIETVEFFARARYWFDQEERKRVATLLAQESLERNGVPFVNVLPRTEMHIIASIQYRVAVTVQANTPDLGVNTVHCIVSWWAKPSIERTVSLATIVFDR
jgi:hypothetical protein